jgi:hypothetical protein
MGAVKMSEIIFSNDIKKNDVLRSSFNQLATDTFGIDFEVWYQKGYWTGIVKSG